MGSSHRTAISPVAKPTLLSTAKYSQRAYSPAGTQYIERREGERHRQHHNAAAVPVAEERRNRAFFFNTTHVRKGVAISL